MKKKVTIEHIGYYSETIIDLFNGLNAAFEMRVSRGYTLAYEPKFESVRGFKKHPVYIYSHGAYRVSSSPFACPWDSWQAGYIKCSKKHLSLYLGMIEAYINNDYYMIACEDEPFGDYPGGTLAEMLAYCEAHGLEVDDINT